jgi:hypothetical protein
MMKKNFHFLLMAVLMCSLNLCVTSCKDDDKDNGPSEEELEQQALEQQDLDNARIAMLDHLADLDEVESSEVDLLSQQFEPVIGVPDENDEAIRYVYTNTMEAAAERFADLVGAEIDENTPSYTWTDEKMGKMIYTKGNGTTAWAEVDVDIKQVRPFTKIIYCTPEMLGENKAFKGRAYYRFGDVVRRKVKESFKTVDEYWVCVRPAFGLEKKEDSHWACINVLPNKNVYTYSTVGTLYFPTKLGESKEHMQNLAEMVYAILNPTTWASNILLNVDNKKMKMFGDFNKNNLKYHNEYFWRNVSNGWDKMEIKTGDGTYDIWELLFESDRQYVATEVNTSAYGMKLLYKGYSWVKKEKVIHLWQANYTSGPGVNSNMHKATFTKPRCDLTIKTVWNLDFRKTGGNQGNYMSFFNPDSNNGDNMMRWCVRFATGKELANKKWNGNVKEAIPGVDEIYRYYRDVDPAGGDLTKEPVADKLIN